MEYPEVIKYKRLHVKLPLGSAWNVMYKEWFDEAIELGVIRKNAYGQYVPLAVVKTVEKIVGKHGRENIIEKEEILDFSAFFEFARRYDAYDRAIHEEDLRNEQRIRELNKENIFKEMPRDMTDNEQRLRKEELLRNS